MSSFYADKSKGSATSLCRAYLDQQLSDQYRYDIQSELIRRSVDPAECQAKVMGENVALATIGAVAVGIGVAAACQDGCPAVGGGGYSPSPNTYKTGYAWDQFYDEYRQLIWRCRDRSNGQFAYDYHCAGKVQFDSEWPSKSALL
jgi:hypothetical protein